MTRARCRADILTELDLPDAELAGERRSDQLLLDQRLGPGDPRLGLLERRVVLVDGRLGTEIALGQDLRAIEVELGEMRLRLVAREIALIGPIVQLDQRIARLDLGTGLEHQLDDAAPELGRHHHLTAPLSPIRCPVDSGARAPALASTAETGVGGGVICAK